MTVLPAKFLPSIMYLSLNQLVSTFNFFHNGFSVVGSHSAYAVDNRLIVVFTFTIKTLSYIMRVNWSFFMCSRWYWLWRIYFGFCNTVRLAKRICQYWHSPRWKEKLLTLNMERQCFYVADGTIIRSASTHSVWRRYVDVSLERLCLFSRWVFAPSWRKNVGAPVLSVTKNIAGYTCFATWPTSCKNNSRFYIVHVSGLFTFTHSLILHFGTTWVLYLSTVLLFLVNWTSSWRSQVIPSG